jgi:hypothetical protein
MEESQTLFDSGYGTAPGPIYARGVPDTPSPDPTTFDKKQYTLILIEIGLCRDFGYHKPQNLEKYSPLIAALKQQRGRVKFVAFPLIHVGTTLVKTLDRLNATFSTVRPPVEQVKAIKGAKGSDLDHKTKTTTTAFSSRCRTLLHT